MITEWIEPIYDRKYWDVQEVQYNPNIDSPKGCVNYTDLNRIENNTKYVLEYMLEQRIIKSPLQLRIKTDWVKTDIPILSETDRIIENIKMLCDLSNPAIKSNLPNIRKASQWTYSLVNDIERCLNIMHNQPRLSANKFLLTLENGIISEYGSDKAYIEEDEVVTIIGVSKNLNDVFTHWTGDADDLQYIEDVDSIKTTFTGQYRDVVLTATFQITIPRTLTLQNAYISLEEDEHAESGPTSGTFYPGDEVMIIANRAPDGKKFKEWVGTREALANISVGENVSTTTFIMPNCNVELQPEYIEAGQHKVTIIDGTGSGWYDCDEIVVISATPPSEQYAFSNWSGNTNYLDNINSSSNSFVMKDTNVTLRAHFTRVLEEANFTVVDGLVKSLTDDTYVSELENVKEGTKLQLLPQPPYPDYGLDYWAMGMTRFEVNEVVTSGYNTTVVGHYAPLHTVTMYNLNNENITQTYSVVENHTLTVNIKNRTKDNYVFDYWADYNDGSVISRALSFNVLITEDLNVIVVYKYQPIEQCMITVENINNAGTILDYVIDENETLVLDTAYQTQNNIFIGWSIDNTIVSTNTHYSLTATTHMTIVANYRPKQNYMLTIVNGTFADETTSKIVKELDEYTIIPNEPQEGYEFWKWSVSNCAKIRNNKAYVLNGNGSVEAEYKLTHNLEVRLLGDDKSYYTVKEGLSQDISSIEYPNYKFNKWTVQTGDGTITNKYSANTKYIMGQIDAIIQAEYTQITPEYKQVTMVNGYVYDDGQWKTSVTVLKGSEVSIQMKPAPNGQQFSQWEVLYGTASIVKKPLAETTTAIIESDCTIQATYSVPEEEILYTATINNKDTVEVYQNPIGYKQSILADVPDEGYKFYRWDGDYQYLTQGRYESNNIIDTPNKNIALTATYELTSYTTKYHLYMYSAKCLIGIDEDTQEEIWATDGEFEAGNIVRIKADTPPTGWKFDGWLGAVFAQTALIYDLYDDETTIIMSNFDCYITATIAQIDKYTIAITNGQTSGEYVENARVDVYFNKTNTTDTHYEFIKWNGDTNLELYSGGTFDIFTAGTAQTPQYIKMPNRRVLLSAEFNELYHLVITGGTITSSLETYFKSGDTITIQANVPQQGYKFSHWSGDTSVLNDATSSTAIVTMGLNPVNLQAVYELATYPNDICYSSVSLKDVTTVNTASLTITSGNIHTGTLITDSVGHAYVITAINNGVAFITRLTKANRGGNVYV